MWALSNIIILTKDLEVLGEWWHMTQWLVIMWSVMHRLFGENDTEGIDVNLALQSTSSSVRNV